MKTSTNFNIDDTLIYKGIGIMLIVIHNYLHWQEGFGIENEIKFNIHNTKFFLSELYPSTWINTFSSVFGFLGHYGVQLFIFFSAYGLAKQFLNNKINYKKYLFKRFKKLYFLLIFGVLLFLISYYFINNKFYDFNLLIKNLFLLSTSISNFNYNTLNHMFVGPFWFFGLMVQLYLIFPFVYSLVRKYNLFILLSLVYVIIYFLFILDINSNFTLFGTIIGHLPEVILGIYFALYNKTKPTLIIFILSLITFAASQINIYAFPLSFISVLIILLYLIEFFKNVLNDFFTNVLKYIGEISMTLFIVNGFFRLFPLFNIQDMTLRGERIFLYLLLLFISCYFIHKLYTYLLIKLKI